ncbi:MAG: single-stranded DNA-binding protein [Clostridia bacterium]|nr:single-stranded DNA-binding protein [Clostridia bacterium]
MNKVFLIGNLTRDPEMSETSGGVSVCHFSIAVNRNYSSADGERQTDFFNVTAWRGLADTIGRFTKKGHKVAVVGSIQMRNYEDNQGVRRTAVDIIAQDIEFLTSKSSNSGDDFYDTGVQPSAPAKKKPTLQSFDDDGDIPF